MGVKVGVGVGVNVLVAVNVGVAVRVGVLVGVNVGVAVRVGVLVGVDVGVGGKQSESVVQLGDNLIVLSANSLPVHPGVSQPLIAPPVPA